MKRMLRLLIVLCMMLMLLPLNAVAEDLTQLYLERAEQNDYTAYLASVGEMDAVTESNVLYSAEAGTPLAEGEQLTFKVNVPQDMF